MREEPLRLTPYMEELERLEPMRWTGEVVELVGLLVESRGPVAGIGDFCEIHASGGQRVRAQVIGFRDGRVLSMPLEEISGIQPGDPVVARSEAARVEVGPGLLGRVLDGFGRPIDGGPDIDSEASYELYRDPPNPLLGAMSRHNSADVSVIALVGERNREVRAFIDHELGKEGLERSVVVVATSDRPAPLRVRACFVALAVAEYFRDRGADVLLVMDSVTRLAMAQREIGLAAGEPPSQKGYTPSVFNLLPKVFERAGNFPRGSITGFFTVLVEGDDFSEPICDAVRAILDGHIVLSRQLAAAGHYPAIDVLNSVSRLTSQVASRDQQRWAAKVREAMAVYQQAEDLIQLGAYVSGTNPKLDGVLRTRAELLQFLRQEPDERSPAQETLARLGALAGSLPA
jgi:flagellar biosynthesis/type III secretory pathway ATPase